ncbi:hypothetical protein [Methanosarcina sp. WWM596]|uniref:hypothetical protein n=1 Tax=Methanosarcina sp. WWM596 TaxID=1434103 RepID=UPI00064F5C5D|nr:hypothetical protein [Methanosarcina sp. WWM596]
MKDATDEKTEKVTRFVTDLPLMLGEVVGECVKKGVEIDVISVNVGELTLMIEACIGEEIKLCNEITGRSPTREEIISVLADRMIKYAEQKQKYGE